MVGSRELQLISTRICICCGKTFSVPIQTRGGGRMEWSYMVRNKDTGKRVKVCSYSCTRKMETAELHNKNGRKKE